MTGVGAAVRKAKVEAGANVVVIGCGAVGLNVHSGREAGRRRPDHRRRCRSAEARARTAIRRDARDRCAARRDVVEQIKALTAGRGADYVFEAAGHAHTFRLAVEAVRPGGQVVWLGKINVDQEVSFRWGSLMGERRIVRSSYGDARPRRDFPWLVREYLAGRLQLDPAHHARIALAEINDGFAALARGEGIRTVVMFD